MNICPFSAMLHRDMGLRSGAGRALWLGVLALAACDAPADADGPSDGVYRTVLIRDHEAPDPASASRTSGADIDGVEIETDGAVLVAEVVEDHGFGSGNNDGHDDPEAALGAPDSVCQSGTPGFVSLAGGDGGYLILSFGAAFRSGDTLSVTECGGEGASPERYDVLVGDGADLHGQWQTCADELQGPDSCVVP